LQTQQTGSPALWQDPGCGFRLLPKEGCEYMEECLEKGSPATPHIPKPCSVVRKCKVQLQVSLAGTERENLPVSCHDLEIGQDRKKPVKEAV
jgi:hypothetical protein